MELGAQIHGFIISCFIIYIVIKILGEEEEAVELYLTAIWVKYLFAAGVDSINWLRFIPAMAARFTNEWTNQI